MFCMDRATLAAYQGQADHPEGGVLAKGEKGKVVPIVYLSLTLVVVVALVVVVVVVFRCLPTQCCSKCLLWSLP